MTSARNYYRDGDVALASVETLRSFGIRAVILHTTVCDIPHGTEYVEWEVIALDLPAEQHHATGAMGPIVDPEPDERIGSAWGWEREDDRRQRDY